MKAWKTIESGELLISCLVVCSRARRKVSGRIELSYTSISVASQSFVSELQRRRRGIECFRPDTMRAVGPLGVARDASKLAIKSPRKDDPIPDDVDCRGRSPSAGRLSAFPRRHSGQVGSLRQPLDASSRQCIPLEGRPRCSTRKRRLLDR